jgi:HAE1 family hydrophobic/amphiphilic exporter-1
VNLSETFIRRPVMTTLVMSAILLFGIMGYRLLPVSDLPNVDFPTISVSASLPGASPETMASAVATPLERQFSTIAGLDTMTSSSLQGSTQITLQFVLSRQIDAAAQDVQAAIARAAKQLPPNMPTPPSYQKVNPADQPILYLALTGSTLPMSTLNEYGDTLMAQRISMVDGVAQVMVFGAQKYAVRVQVDPWEMASRGIGIDEVEAAIERANVNLPTGILYGPHRSFTVQASGQLLRAPDYRPLIVAYRGGAPVRLRELGQVIDSVENNKTFAWYCTPERQEPAIVLAVQRQPGTNTVEVAGAVKALLPTFRAQMPASVQINTLFDRSLAIHDSARDVQFTLLLTLGLVVMVIFLFLRNLSATVIPSLALPMSVVGTFIAMYALDYSLDNLSLMALTLAVGFVVDDAIVMLENVVRHMEMGKPRLQAALDGSKEVGFTIVSMTLSLAAVFIPVLFMGGIVGRLFREFAVTIGAAVIVSGVVSLTLTPMLCSRFLRSPESIHHGHIYAASERVFDWMIRLYGWTLSIVLRQKLLTMAVSLAILAGTVYLAVIMKMEFLPSEDRGQLLVQTEAAESTSYTSMFAHQQALASIVQKDPNIRAFMSSAGSRVGAGGAGGAANTGRMFILLKGRAERPQSVDEMVQSLRPKLAQVPGVRAFLQNPPSIQVGARSAKNLYQYTLLGPDTDELYRAAGALIARMQGMTELQDVTSDMQLKNPEIDINIDRDQASAKHVSALEIEQALSDAYGSTQISTIFAPTNQYQVILELLPEFQVDPEALAMLFIRSDTGDLVPIKSVAELKEGFGPLLINHSGQLPSVTISFNLAPGAALGDAVDKVNAVAREVLPADITTGFQGTAQAFKSSTQGMYLLLALAVLVIYIVLGVLYENFWHPLTILSALPFAGFGALLTLWAFNVNLSIIAFVGIIMLVGLVKKNGIMMIDFAIEGRRAGKSDVDAIHEACLIRFRPIMMTTMCALMAGLPIAFGWGAGAEARRPLGLAVVGGLVFSQTLTLYVTPVFYVLMERWQSVLRRHPTAGALIVVSAFVLVAFGIVGYVAYTANFWGMPMPWATRG